MTTFGLAIKNFVGPTETPDVDALYAYAERAEALGFESLWAWDHVLLGVEPAFPILDAVGILTAIAARTSRIKLGTGILVPPLRNPTVAAKALGTLDVISKGRLIVGAAAGWYAREFDAVGVAFKQRGRLFERNLEILTRLWTEARVTLQTDEFNLREAVMVPRTVQRPRPPILIGGYVDAVLRRVATKGDGWLTYFYTPESYRRTWEKIIGFAPQAGRDPATLSGTNQLAIYGARSRGPQVPPALGIVPVIQGLLDLFRARRVPVMFTEFVYSPSAPVLIGALHPEHLPTLPGTPRGFGLPSSSCLEGTPSAETVPALAPRP